MTGVLAASVALAAISSDGVVMTAVGFTVPEASCVAVTATAVAVAAGIAVSVVSAVATRVAGPIDAGAVLVPKGRGVSAESGAGVITAVAGVPTPGTFAVRDALRVAAAAAPVAPGIWDGCMPAGVPVMATAVGEGRISAWELTALGAAAGAALTVLG